jgi:hypothetical protein
MKKFLTTLAVLTAIAQPAFAQSVSPSPYGTGMLPFTYQPAAPQNDRIAAGHGGLNTFAIAPRHGSAVDLNGPASAGGGSRGYNESPLTW